MVTRSKITRFREYVSLGEAAPGTEQLSEMAPAMGEGEREGVGLTVDAEGRVQTIRDEFGKAMADRLKKAITDGIDTLSDAFADIRTLYKGMEEAVNAVTQAGVVSPDPSTADNPKPVPASESFVKDLFGGSDPFGRRQAGGEKSDSITESAASSSAPDDRREFAKLFRQ